ncbi:MAG: transposase [Candidatus Omnitrophica bacterium]|nr:transposase [Candidatus Omnitrophota bacterium]
MERHLINRNDAAYFILPYSREKVLPKLKQKKYDDIFWRGRGKLDDFIAFLFQSGFLSLFDTIESPMQRAPEIPRKFLHYCLTLKSVVEAASIHQLPDKLFKDTITLRELGFTIEEIKGGFSIKNKAGKNTPVNINAVYDELARLPEITTLSFFQKCGLLLREKKFITSWKGVYALDSTKLLITGYGYENIGQITYKKDGKKIKEKGYKLVYIQRVDGNEHYIVAAILVPLNQNESTVAKKLVEQALSILGEGSISILLFDRELLSAEFFDYLKREKGIDFICPTKERQHLTRYMRGLHRIGEETKTTLSDGTVLAGYNHLIKMEGCRSKINGVLILYRKKKGRKKIVPGKEFGYLTTLPVNRPSQIEKVYFLYSRRWKIEINGNRELKSSWYLNKFPGESWNAVCTHIYFTLFMFNVVAAYKSKKGRCLTENGFLSLRNKYFQGFDKEHDVIVYANGYVGTFSFLEFLEIFGLPPPTGILERMYPKLIVYPNGKKQLWL